MGTDDLNLTGDAEKVVGARIVLLGEPPGGGRGSGVGPSVAVKWEQCKLIRSLQFILELQFCYADLYLYIVGIGAFSEAIYRGMCGSRSVSAGQESD